MKKIHFLIYLLSAFFLIGCSGYLSEENKSALTQETYFKTANQAESSVIGIYETLQTFSQEIEYRGDAIWTVIEMQVGHCNRGGSQYKEGMITHTSSSNEPHYYVLWSNFYKGIANANLAIKRLPNVQMDDKRKQALLGEVYFLRALFYYYLVRLYGDIPLIVEPIDYSSEDLYPSRTSVEEIYKLIVDDLLKAEDSGIAKIDQTGRASLGAVKSLLASVYLTMAGHPLNKGTQYYKLAAAKSKEVIDGNFYKLFDNYLYLHDREHKNKDELIFQVQYLAGIKTNRITEFVSPRGVSKLTDDMNAVRPLQEFVNSYEENDKRTEEKQFYFTQDFAKGSTTQILYFEPALYKFYLEEAAGRNGDMNSDLNWTLVRLPEILLIYAEASNEAEGPNSYAYEQVNKIRRRANLKELNNLTKDEFREAIWRERYHELAYENKAFFDIQRTRKAFNLKTGHFEDVLSFTNELGIKFPESYLLWAIPQKEVDANDNLTQNPGY